MPSPRRAGSAEVRLSHTAEFLFADPRRTALAALGLELPLTLGGKVESNLPGGNALFFDGHVERIPFESIVDHDLSNRLNQLFDPKF